jgi:hypothetical protein
MATFKKSFTIIVSLVLLFSGGRAWAQAQQDLPKPNQNVNLYRPPGEIPAFSDILKNIHASYAVSFMGPRLEGSSGETYNIYLPDVSSIQLYHSLRVGYQVTSSLQMGIGSDIVNNLKDGTVATTGKAYHHSFEWYDPYLYFNFPDLIRVPGWWVFTSASFSLPVTTPSQNAAKITNLVISQSWSINNFPSPWRYGFRLYLNPQFYTDPMPTGYIDRQTLYFSFGHFWGYQFNPAFSVTTSSHFDLEHRSPASNGFFSLGSSLPDFIQLSASFTPNLQPAFLSCSVYLQSLIWNPSMGTSIMGAQFSIGF